MSALTTLLSPLEIRVLGVLAEKQRTVPDSYPLTLNSLLAGCNQKTSRQPIMELSEAQAQLALESLKRYSLVTETSGGRAYRYGHNIDGVLRIPFRDVLWSFRYAVMHLLPVVRRVEYHESAVREEQ